MNESTWLEPPTQDAVDYMAKIGARLLTAEEWEALLVGAGLQDVVARAYRLNYREEAKGRIEKAEELGADISSAQETLEQAIDSLEFQSYDESKELATKSKERASFLMRDHVESALSALRKAVEEADSNGLDELTPWTVGTAGGGFFFDSQPLTGQYSAYNGFDGEAGLFYTLRQAVTIPAGARQATLTTNHRIRYSSGGSAAEERIFKIETILADLTNIGRVWAGGIAETRAAAMEVLLERHPPRRSQSEPADVVVYGVPNWSPYATFATMNPILTLISSAMGYMGGYIEALGKPGCSVIITTPCPEVWDREHHAAYPEVWERVLPETRDPYEITERFGEEFATRADYVERYRNRYAYHPIHAILATHPLKRLRHAARVFVAGAENPETPRHIGFIPTATVEEAIAEAKRIHGSDCSIVCIKQFAGA